MSEQRTQVVSGKPIDQELADALAADMQKDFDEKMAETLVTQAVCEPRPLTIESLKALRNGLNRKFNFVYVLESSHIPADAWGILMLRPEDAKKWAESREDSDNG